MEATVMAGELAASPAEELAPPSPASPSFSIPAVKVAASRRSTIDLQAWVALPGSPSAFAAGGASAGAGGGSACSEAADQQTRPPVWTRAWHRLAAAAGAVAAVAARAVLPSASALGRDSNAMLGPRSQSMEVLSLGREVSAPYMPSKRAGSLILRLPGGEAAAAAPAPTGQKLAVLRWRRAVRAVADAREALRCLDLLADRLAVPQDRLHAAFSLGTLLEGYGQQQQDRLAWALLARRRAGRLRCVDHIVNELYMTGERIFTFFTPPPMGQHFPYATLTLLFVLILVYFFMAGQYGLYQAMVAPSTSSCLAALRHNGTSSVWGPAGMVRWIAPRQEQWCYAGSAGKFDAAFLIDWGARYAPRMRSSPQRWITSTLLHQSFAHLASNCAMLGGFGWQVEAKHGSWRIALLFLLAGLGGNLLSAVTEAPCVAVVGASGIVFGAAAATVADTLQNFATLGRPLLRTAVLLAFLVFFSVTVGTTLTGTSHMSHVGGFLAGLLGALCLLRTPHRGRTELARAAAGLAGAAAMFAALPCIFYLRQLPGVSC
ncbi:hypothetical protein ABPG75_000737 [Micractinium tetrahymenae]